MSSTFSSSTFSSVTFSSVCSTTSEGAGTDAGVVVVSHTKKTKYTKSSSRPKKLPAVSPRSLVSKKQKKASKDKRLLVAELCIKCITDYCDDAGIGGSMRIELEKLMFSESFRSRTGVRFLSDVPACGVAQVDWFVHDGTVTRE